MMEAFSIGANRWLDLALRLCGLAAWIIPPLALWAWREGWIGSVFGRCT